jgi:tetratricopeptide (TPR) repeat protein
LNPPADPTRSLETAPTGTLETALAHTQRLLQTHPEMALAQASEILKVIPGHPPAALLKGVAQRLIGDTTAAVQTLHELTATQGHWAPGFYELGLALLAAGRSHHALAALRRAVAIKPDMLDAWRAIGDQLSVAGDSAGADAAYAEHIRASSHDPRLLAAGAAMIEGRIPEAERRLKEHLKAYPTDVPAIRMLAEVAARIGRNKDAAALLNRCLELAPSFAPARHQYAIVLQRLDRYRDALEQVGALLKTDPRNAAYHNNRAVILTKIGEYREAIDLYERILKVNPHHESIWLSYGHVLATAGRQADAIAAYRKCIEIDPGMGDAYWSLANLKTFRFDAPDVTQMRWQLTRDDISEVQRCSLEFSLGKGTEDDGLYAEAMQWYLAANARRRKREAYHGEEVAAFVKRSKALFTQEFFAARRDRGAPGADPIFIVGMPRAGSTLIEQILASHSEVEGTMELPNIITMAAELGSVADARSDERPYPGVLARLDAAAARRLGEEYLEETRIQRKTTRPFFIDKMPNNFLHVGLICLILPNAKIIDARRHPMACCFSAFKMQFSDGHRYSYDLHELGECYRLYVEYMQHFDAVLPGRIHRVHHESLVDDTETEVRKLLDYCGLEFEPGCLRFHDNKRPVRTPSAQQVRRPIYREGLEHWRHFEPWLGPLAAALGDVLAKYPEAPNF